MLVEATRTGFFGNKRIKEGQQFEIRDLKIELKDKDGKITTKTLTVKEQFSSAWMEEVSPKEAKLNPKPKVAPALNDNESVI